ncbi:MAG TPA: TMEM175 family protein [Gammaproteobacteria bacterium]|nr:TMEM175 family protein [Gammaproteobacteria bacterium]
MPKTRLEAFSDGVIAIIITVMLLNMEIPQSPTLKALLPVAPVFVCYVLSFLYLAIYWNNHHHMLQATEHVSAGILWANSHLLFWLSLLPFATGWMGENRFAPIPTALYGVILLMCALSYFILQYRIIDSQGRKSLLKKAVGSDLKGKLSIILYIVGILISVSSHWSAICVYFLVALMWLVPDKRIERVLH